MRPAKNNHKKTIFLYNQLLIKEQHNARYIKKLEYARADFVSRLDQYALSLFKILHNKTKILKTKISNVSTSKELNQARNSLEQVASKLNDGAEYLDDIIYQAQNHIDLKFSKVDLNDFFIDLLEDIKNNYDISVELNIRSKARTWIIDYNIIKGIFEELIVNVSLAKNINLIIEPDTINYSKDTDEIKEKRESIKVSIIATDVPMYELDTSLNNKIIKIIDSHYGNFSFTNDVANTNYSITIPIDINSIRPKYVSLHKEYKTECFEQSLTETLTNKNLIEIIFLMLEHDISLKTIAGIFELDEELIKKLIFTKG